MRYFIVTCLFIMGSSQAKSASMDAVTGSHELLRMLGGLLLVLLIIGSLVWVLRRLQAGGFTLNPGMRCIGGMSLGSRERLVLVEVGGRYLLLGVTNAQVNLLSDFGTHLPEGFEAVKKPSFSAILQTALRKKQ